MILSYFQRYRLRNYCDILFVGDLVGRESEPSVDVRKMLSIGCASGAQGKLPSFSSGSMKDVSDEIVSIAGRYDQP